MSEKTAEDRRHEVRLLVYGFLLTTLAGSTLTYVFQWLENRQQTAAENRTEDVRLLEQRRDRATELFRELSELMDTRLYKWRQIAWGLEDRLLEAELQRRYADYRETFLRWNYSLNRNRALLCRFFGPEIGFQFEGEIMPAFTTLQNTVNEILKQEPAKRPSFQPNELNARADELNNLIYDLDNRMAEAIRSGQIGLQDPGQACDPRKR